MDHRRSQVPCPAEDHGARSANQGHIAPCSLPLPFPLPPPFPSMPTSPLPSMYMPVAELWMDQPAKQCNATNTAAFLPNICDFTSEPCYEPSALSTSAPELIIKDAEHHLTRQPNLSGHCSFPTRALSTSSFETQTTSSASLLSSVGSDRRSRTSSSDDSLEPLLPCLGPQCDQVFSTTADLEAHVESAHTHPCNWAGCDNPSFETHDALVWHVKENHLLICPFPGCTETSLQSARAVRSHVDMVHTKVSGDKIKEWRLEPVLEEKPSTAQTSTSKPDQQAEPTGIQDDGDHAPRDKGDILAEELVSIKAAKSKYQEQLRKVLDKRSKKNGSTPKSADSPSDLVRGRASRLIETANFPLVFEHSILPFLSEFLPGWVGPYFAIAVTKGKSPQFKRISIMTRKEITRPRKVIIVRHIQDLLPDKFHRVVSFAFSVGEVNRITWARGLSKDHMDDICAPRNPYFFKSPCMGDSIGIPRSEACEDSTATLGPALVVGGGKYWLGNFHPFLEAYQKLDAAVQVEHPSLQDRGECIEHGHDAMAQEVDFNLGKLEATSGLNLKTTRVSHEPYWEECDKEQPLIVTDWSLISSRTSHANVLRRFPSEAHPLFRASPIISTSSITPGNYVTSSGRTSGHQRGQVCEIPAYVSGDENGTMKATREWFLEEPCDSDDEEEWIRGGIGVEGDSGAAVVDLNDNTLIGQIWGRNRYWGPGPRLTYFTPITDIFDDIQEKCGQETRPQLPQHRNEDDCFPLYPSCRQCYDMRTYHDSRRSSRLSLQSMIMGKGDLDHDVSELATPRDCPRYAGVEEIGSSFVNFSFGPGTPGVVIADAKSPYAPNLDTEDLYDQGLVPPKTSRKRGADFLPDLGTERHKRQRA